MIEYTEIIGLIAGFLTAFSTVPQSIKIIQQKGKSNVSVAMLSMLTASYILWLIYGIALGLISIIIWNVVALSFGAAILALKVFIWPTQEDKQTSPKPAPQPKPHAPAE